MATVILVVVSTQPLTIGRMSKAQNCWQTSSTCQRRRPTSLLKRKSGLEQSFWLLQRGWFWQHRKWKLPDWTPHKGVKLRRKECADKLKRSRLLVPMMLQQLPQVLLPRPCSDILLWSQVMGYKINRFHHCQHPHPILPTLQPTKDHSLQSKIKWENSLTTTTTMMRILGQKTSPVLTTKTLG